MIWLSIAQFIGGIWTWFASLPSGVKVAIVAIIAGSLLLIGVNNRAYDRGAADMKAGYVAAQLEATEAARVKEQDWQAKLNASQSALAKERQDALKRESSLRADIDAGTRKLRIAIAKQQLPNGSDSAPGSDDTTAELAPEARRAYHDLRAAIIADTQTIKACQGYARAIGAD